MSKDNPLLTDKPYDETAVRYQQMVDAMLRERYEKQKSREIAAAARIPPPWMLGPSTSKWHTIARYRPDTDEFISEMTASMVMSRRAELFGRGVTVDTGSTLWGS